ncbi:peptide ABC transporter substrate-binding protein [Clostridium cylindrosporum]|uniref:Oligopeptide-binding protein OppA n=1 Tax=Clostridium cylindrosporum DSM 605 TaxID=1121307 RepID=A0A0J8DB21_CLOCY|nr:peptide ABC transporter substrate-binding protein [Clostridium cylindrosporum]KMT23270.1 oligopeptide-binding protein OppA [Clostridium cylindrosporum DSM 605]
MLMKKLSKALAIGLTAVLMVTGLSSCGKSSSENKIVFNIEEQEGSIDPAINNSMYMATLIENAFEGLVRLDENQKPKPGIAKSWKVSPDGKEYTFELRNNARWSDGMVVNAKDFQFAWKRVLNKKTASPYSGYMMCIKGAKEYFEGKAKEVVGINVVDDFKMKITLTNPTPYFLELTALGAFMPIREDVAKNPEWSNRPETYISNGPLNLTEWRAKEIMIYEKNKSYWNKDAVKLDKLEVKMIAEPTKAFDAFKKGELDYIENPPAQEIPSLLKNGTAKKYQNLGTYMYMFNLSDKMKQKDPKAYAAMNNPNVRRALALAIDRKEIVETVSKGVEKAASSIVPPGIKDSKGKDFKDKEYFKLEGNVAEAKKLLAEAGYPNGQGFPQIELMYNKGGNHEEIAKTTQEMWKKNLNIDIKLVSEEWKVFLDKLKSKDYTMARKGWVADYRDPSTFLSLFETNGENNETGYSNPEVDKLFKKASSELDESKRFEAYHKIESIILNDMPVIPIYYYTDVVCINPKVKGVYKSPLGHITFYKAQKEK